MPTRTNGRRRFLQLTGLTVAGALAGCAGFGGDDESSGGGGESGDGSDAGGSESGDGSDAGGSESEDGSDDGGGEGGSTDTSDDDGTSDDTSTADETIVVAPGGNLEFSPDTLEIEAGDTVEFVWEGSNHNIVVENQPDDADWEGVPGLQDSGYSTTHTFDVAGSYDFYCEPHRAVGMEGTITVS